MLPYFLSKIAAEAPLSSIYPCLSAVIMYKLCGLNSEPGRLATFILILVVESLASTALGMVCICSLMIHSFIFDKVVNNDSTECWCIGSHSGVWRSDSASDHGHLHRLWRTVCGQHAVLSVLGSAG